MLTRIVMLGAALVLTASCSRSPQDQAAAEASEVAASFRAPQQVVLQPMLGPVLADLAKSTPGLAARLPGIAAEERRLLAQLTAAFRARTGAAGERATAAASVPTGVRVAADGGPLAWLIPAAHAQSSGGGILDLVSGLGVTYLGGGAAEGFGADGKDASDTQTVTGKEGQKASIRIDTTKDGVVTTTIESNVDVPPLGMVAGTRTSISTKTLCPDAEGRVDLTIRLRRSGNTGNAAATGQSVETRVSIVVNDQAEIASAEFQTKYDAATSGKGGGARITGAARFAMNDGKSIKVIDGKSEGSGDFDALERDTVKSALLAGVGAMSAAKSHWQGGKCISLAAESPGNVSPGTVSQIDVKTTLKAGGAPVRANVTATLTGGASVDPADFPTPGKFAHTAVNEKDKTMDIALKAVSRRGADEKRLRVTTNEQQYRITGGGGEFRGTGVVCDLKKPFTVRGNANIVMKFVPATDREGTYSYTGQISGAKLFGKGQYWVGYNWGTPTSITARGPGSASSPYGTFTRSDEENYTLTPVSGQPCE